jgi:ectoine hydroxylase-related dioxygenase (phytanoyl-CoA dioxygenase family)
VTPIAYPAWLVDSDYDLDDFRELVSRKTDHADVPNAMAIERNVPIYAGEALYDIARDPVRRRELLGELAWVLGQGPGVLAVQRGLTERNRLSEATEIFNTIIAEQHAAGRAVGDHFAKPGSNDRVWNSHEKLAEHATDVFVAYYSADAISLGCEAWLGPHYQISAQVNRVNPGGTAQSPHRDYHLGFYTPEEMDRFPRHVHLMSQALTLQGAVAHTDMALESGPTMLLPFSQLSHAGFIASLRDDFREVFHEYKVQMPMKAGDVAFFNPAVFHGAGANVTTDFQRMNNLLQVSSAFGRAMEAVDREAMSNALFPALLRRARAGEPETVLRNAIAASAEGYAFPTNLDRDPPIGGLAPPSQADVVRRAHTERWPEEQLDAALANHARRRLTHG